MKTFSKGVYLSDSGLIICLTKVETYEDLKSIFWLVTYEYECGSFPKTLLTEKNLKHFKRIGPL